MIDIRSNIYGIPIKSPVVVGSSGLSNKLENIKAFAESGAGAVVLKSIFEEEILIEHEQLMKNRGRYDEDYEFLDYFDYQIKQEKLGTYIALIKKAKESVDIPIIASINCISSGEWIPFAKELEKAGADGIELNILSLPVDISKSSIDYEKEYTKIIQSVKSSIKIPVGIKIGNHYTNLGATIKHISELSNGVTLFNRPFKPDIDIHTKTLKPGSILTSEESYQDSLRWLFLMSNQCKHKLYASTGIHNGETLIKLLMAGAPSCQVVSGIYKNGPRFIQQLIKALEEWMDQNKITKIADIGSIIQNDKKNSEYFMRSQFLAHFGSYEKEFN